jgi:hypothetical protein
LDRLHKFWSLIYLGMDSPPSLPPSTVVVGGIMFGPLDLVQWFHSPGCSSLDSMLCCYFG